MPVEHSSLDLTVINSALLEAGYSGQVTSFEYLEKGLVNDNYEILLDNRPAILRIWKLENVSQVRAELELLTRLNLGGLPVPEAIVPNSKTQLFIEDLPAVVFQRIPGRLGENVPRVSDNYAAIVAKGRRNNNIR